MKSGTTWRGFSTRNTCMPSGLPLRIVATCVDCGFKDATVLRFTRDRYNRRVYATKGRAGESPIWPRKPSRKNQTPFFMIGVDGAKAALYDRLKIGKVGAGLLPLPDWPRPGVLRAAHRGEKVHPLPQRLPQAGMAQAGKCQERSSRCAELCVRRAACAVRQWIEAPGTLRPFRADGRRAARVGSIGGGAAPARQP